ncbi:MAG: PduL/EutD family phosphate acyltransferase [Flavonifractor plautii]
MDKNNVVSAEIVRQITRMVVEELQKQQRLERSTPIGVSNRHVHLDRADMDALFGPGSELTVKKCSASRGSMSAEETVTIRGPKGSSAACACWGPCALRRR